VNHFSHPAYVLHCIAPAPGGCSQALESSGFLPAAEGLLILQADIYLVGFKRKEDVKEFRKLDWYRY
jgi:hypothetical protein